MRRYQCELQDLHSTTRSYRTTTVPDELQDLHSISKKKLSTVLENKSSLNNKIPVKVTYKSSVLATLYIPEFLAKLQE